MKTLFWSAIVSACVIVNDAVATDFDPGKPQAVREQEGMRVRVDFLPLMKLDDWPCRLRTEGSSRGEELRWFDGSLNDNDWPKVSLVGFWSPENDPTAWYRLRFSVPPGVAEKTKDKTVFLVFGGVDESCWVWLNGKKIGSHSEEGVDGWDMPFALKVTDNLKVDGENLLAVKVLNRTMAGGIWRSVVLAVEESRTVLGTAPAKKKDEPWKDPKVLQAEKAMLDKHIEQRLPVTAPPGRRHGSPSPLERERAVLFTTEQLSEFEKPGGKIDIKVSLKKVENVAITIDFQDAAFGGADIRCRVNGRVLPSYLALGEDSRYAEAKKNPNLHPPEAKIQANWVVPKAWAGKNLEIKLENAGPGWAKPTRLMVSRVDADNAPRYQNPVPICAYLWFWQGNPGFLSNEEDYWNRLILGTIPGSQAFAHHVRSPEDSKVGYSIGKVHWYTLPHYKYEPQTHNDLVVVDNDPKTEPIRLRTRDGMRKKLEEWLKTGLVPARLCQVYLNWDYVDLLTLYLEQDVPDWAVNYTYAAKGYTPKVWAEAWVQSDEQVKSLLNESAPWVRLSSEFNFRPSMKEWVLKVPTQQLGHKARDYMDSINDHCFGFHYPEVALEMNRLRLGRSEKDLVVPKPERLAGSEDPYRVGKDGGIVFTKPEEFDVKGAQTSSLDYRVGFDGDEELSNDETVGFGAGTATYLQGDNTAYRFLYGLIAYSLLPTGEGESKEPPGVKIHGVWENGPKYTKRLRTKDPLFGDLFGFSRWEYCSSGGSYGMRGPLERCARRPPEDAFLALRRAGLGFQADGPVFPVCINDKDSANLLIKAFTGHFDWVPFIELAAVNEDDVPHALDVSLYVGHNQPIEMLVFNDRAALKHDGRAERVSPQDGELRYQATVPGRSAWQVLIFDKDGKLSSWAGAPDTPTVLAPQKDADLGTAPVALKWGSGKPGASYILQLGTEALFAKKHLLQEEMVKGNEFAVPERFLKPKTRLWWRVRAVAEDGTSSAWSAPSSFCYQWSERAKFFTEQREKLRKENAENREKLEAIYAREKELNLRDENNLVASAYVAKSNSNYVPSGAAVDFSYRTCLELPMPGTLTLEWKEPRKMKAVRIYWDADQVGRDYRVLAWEGMTWKEVSNVVSNLTQNVEHSFPQEVTTQKLQLEIGASNSKIVNKKRPGVVYAGIRELRVD